MRNYEVTFIVDPVLSGDEIKAAAQSYQDLVAKNGEIVYVDEMGLRQLAYPIKRRSSGVYYCIEFKLESGEFIQQMELVMRRDERIIRFLSIKLDKYGVKYNDDKRNGLIGKKKKKSTSNGVAEKGNNKKRVERKPVAAKKAAPVPAPAPVAVATEEEE